MSFAWRITTVLFLAVLAPVQVAAACVSSSRGVGDYNYFDHYRLVYTVGTENPGEVPPHLVDEIERAVASWNDPGCNEDAHYPSGHTFPYFTSEAGGTTRDIDLIFVSGKNEMNKGSCADFSGSMITLYSKAERPGGGDYNCDNTRIFEDNVAHELGHVLGFNDSGCAGYAMQDTGFTPSGSYVDRRVDGDECTTAQETHYTKSEQKGDQCATGGPGCDDWNPSMCEPCGGC